MRRGFFKSLIECGVPENALISQKRSIVFSNYISLILSAAGLLLFILIPENHNLGGLTESLAAVALFSIPLILNQLSLTTLSRFYLCWVPPLLITWAMILGMKESSLVSPSSYNGLRIYLLATSCVPYLLLERKNTFLFILGVLPNLLLILFCDYLLDLEGVGYSIKGIQDLGYGFTQARTLVSYAVIGGSCLSLRYIVDKSDELNQQLLNELKEKNELILQQKASEVNELDRKLYEKIQELRDRELILNESQRIAKIGSWKFSLETESLFWSDEMYNILGVDRNTSLTLENLRQIFQEQVDGIGRVAYEKLMTQGEALDISLPVKTPLGYLKWLRINGFVLHNNSKISGAMGICHDITLFKEAEEQMAINEKKYRSLFEQASDAIMVTDMKGEFLDVNTSMCNMLGYKKEELLRLNIADIIDPDQLIANPLRHKEIYEGAMLINERLYMHKNGTRVPVESNVKRVAENAVMSIARNITERKETNQKLKKYIRELALLNAINAVCSNSPDVSSLLSRVCKTLIKEGGYKLVWIGQEVFSSSGHIVKPMFTVGEASAYTENLLIDLKDKIHRKGPAAHALLTGETRVINFMWDDPDYLNWRSYASMHGLHSSAGICINAEPVDRYVLNIYSAHVDGFGPEEVSILERISENMATTIKSIYAASERDFAKRELQGTYERLNYHINNTPLAVIERDKDFNIVSWNKRAEELFGWRESEVLGKKAHEFLVPPEEVENAKNRIYKLAKENFAGGTEIKNIAIDGRILYCHWYYSTLRNEDGGLQALLSFVSDVTEQKSINYKLGERLKELTTLRSVSELLNQEEEILDDLLAKVVQVLPPGWQYPDITAARIVIGGIEFKTPNYSTGAHMQRAEFYLPQGMKGIVEIVYLEQCPQEAEDAFFAEERNLLNMIAEMLRSYFAKRHESMALKSSEANLSATFNNTDILIWSVDRNLKLIAFNKPFYNHIKKNYGLEIKIGTIILGESEKDEDDLITKKWNHYYQDVLSGDVISLEETRFGIDFHYSLRPIIEDDARITGVNVFATNVTEEKRRGRELAGANKEIGELKLKALRSVMNPHFIFNVLNSIQFFVAANDRLNAINYLSKFSKLTRSILTNSVNNKIKLSEEIEILNNYVQLEMVRFEAKFDFKMEVDPNLETDSIEIPSLLVQPYVENAILHGLYNKKTKGNLSIKIREEKDAVVFEIEDDGVGRQAAAKFREQNFSAHKSMGTKLTEERLKLINEHHNVSFEIIDLANTHGPCGTRIIIWVKI